MVELISFTTKKRSSCDHKAVLIDEALWQIECAECGEILDPIWYLISLARREQKAKWRITELKEQEQKILNKLRCKCQHCGKMTRI